MTKSNGKLIMVCVFICLIILSINSSAVKAQSAVAIVINSDGSVSGTSLIQRNGDVCRLTGSINNVPITVLCDNIVLDGEGFVLKGAGGWGTPGVPGVENTAAICLTCSNVTVQNFNISGWETGVAGTYNGNIVSDNNISRTEAAVAIYADNYTVRGNFLANSIYAVYVKGNGTYVSQNQIVNNYGGVMIYPSLMTTITQNNFANNTIDINIGTYADFSYQIYDNNFIIKAGTTVAATTSDALGPVDEGTLASWDNGSVGNYWSDYATKYPNAIEIGNSGIGDTPYLIRVNPTVIDRYPLMTPVSIQNVAETSSVQTPTPTSTPNTAVSKAVSSSGSSPNPRSSISEASLIAALIIAVASCVAVLAFRNKLFWLQKNGKPA
jgi:parallel beta-helix repeat protein